MTSMSLQSASSFNVLILVLVNTGNAAHLVGIINVEQQLQSTFVENNVAEVHLPFCALGNVTNVCEIFFHEFVAL